MKLTQFTAISPLDGRYFEQLSELVPIFSEYGLMRYRLVVEIKWLQFLASNKQLTTIPSLSARANKFLAQLIVNFSAQDVKVIKTLEKKINHDLKAVEYFLRQRFKTHIHLAKFSEFIHFACTSADINNLAYGLMLNDTLKTIVMPQVKMIISKLRKLAHKYAKIPMLARTHGQPATPTTMGKELANFVARLDKQYNLLKHLKISGKINGAVGNYNAHVVAFPKVNWIKLSQKFVRNLGLEVNLYTTQIEPHDTLAELSQIMLRINTILLDCCRDMWSYISREYFLQKVIKTEVGSSTMPYKVNPITFEQAEGNLGFANALLQHFATKLPIARMQRDLSDSTVMRNIGVAFAHSLLAYKSLMLGFDKVTINRSTIAADLMPHIELLTEALQTVMRKYGIVDSYEQLKNLARGRELDQVKLLTFIDTLPLPQFEKSRLKQLCPENYLGLAVELAEKI